MGNFFLGGIKGEKKKKKKKKKRLPTYEKVGDCVCVCVLYVPRGLSLKIGACMYC